MKYLALILSLVLIGLNANSLDVLSTAGDEVDCCKSSTASCTDEATADFPLDQDEGECDGPCNPLISCCGQMGFIIPEVIPNRAGISSGEELNGKYFKPSTSTAIPSIWNPPKRG